MWIIMGNIDILDTHLFNVSEPVLMDYNNQKDKA